MAEAEGSIRPATPDDAPALAELIDLAGEGIPRWLWSQSAAAGQSPIEIGSQRAAREEGGFSYRNAHVAETDGRVIGLLLGYPLPDPYPAEDLSAVLPVVRPLLELEALAPGSWYVNAIAVREQARGGGWGRRLMELAEELARRCGAAELSLIVAEENQSARGLYERLGYEVRSRRELVPLPGAEQAGDWLLMVKPVG